MPARFHTTEAAIRFAEELPGKAYLYGNAHFLLVARQRLWRSNVQLLEIFHNQEKP